MVGSCACKAGTTNATVLGSSHALRLSLARATPAQPAGKMIDIACARPRRIGLAPAIVSAVIGVSLWSCHQDEPSSQSPVLHLIDTVRLAESDTSFVGLPTGLRIGRDGVIWIPDGRNSTIHEYAPDGEHLRDIGRRGSGPGEFEAGPAELLLANDTLGIVEDGSEAKLLDLQSGDELWARLIPSTSIPPAVPLAYQRGRAIFRLIDTVSRTTLMGVGTAVDSPLRGGPFPEPLGPSRIINDNFSYLQVVPLGDDSIGLAIELSNFLFVGPYQGPFDSIRVAHSSRRGALPKLLSSISDDQPQSAAAAVFRPSIPMLLARLADGKIAYVTADFERLSSRLAGTLYLSVIDLQRRRTCPDALVPVPSDPFARVAFAGDTLFVLAQVLPEGGAPYTVLRRYQVDTESCTWAAGT